MEQGAVLVLSSKPPRIVPEAVQKSVGVKGDIPGSGDAREPTPHGWTETRGKYGSRMILSKVTKQHLSDQVHAGPILLQKITDDCNAGQGHRIDQSWHLTSSRCLGRQPAERWFRRSHDGGSPPISDAQHTGEAASGHNT